MTTGRTRSWSRTRRVKNAVWASVVRLAVAAFSRVPRRIAGVLGAALGTLAFHLSPSLRRTAIAGASRIEASHAKASFRSLGRAALEVVTGLGDAPALLASVRIDPADLARLDAARTERRGVLFLSAHLGAWELLAWTIAARGYDVTVVARESYDPRLTRLVRRLRRARGVGVVLRGGRSGAGRILRALRRGGIVGMLVDQDARVPGVFVPFLGAPAWTPRGPAEIALRTGAAVVTGACVREGDGWRIVVRRVPVTRRGEDDVRENTARFTRAIESLVRAWPSQWTWLHDRWKSPAPQQPRDQPQAPPGDLADRRLEVGLALDRVGGATRRDEDGAAPEHASRLVERERFA